MNQHDNKGATRIPETYRDIGQCCGTCNHSICNVAEYYCGLDMSFDLVGVWGSLNCGFDHEISKQWKRAHAVQQTGSCDRWLSRNTEEKPTEAKDE